MGAGGHGAVVADILGHAAGFIDDDPAKRGTSVLGLPVFASLDEVVHDAIIIAIGDNATRRALTERYAAAGERFASAIHPRASIAPSALIGEGSVICAGALVLPRAVVGRGAIVNTKAAVDHDCVVGDFVHIAAGATLGGDVRVGDGTLIALGASVVPGIAIGARSVVGAGAVVVRELPDDVTALGVPARITSDRRSATSTR